jgi:polysaccharide export outer membrane protein
MKKLTVLLCIGTVAFGSSFQLPNYLITQLPGDDVSNDSITNDIMTPFDEPYLIESGDMLEITIMGEEELNRTLMVMHNGMISFPLVGEVKVEGLTTDQAEEVIAKELKEYYTYPMVSVVLKSPTQPYVSVFGEVMRQGAVEYQRGLRVTDYIALAGGPTSKANLGKVKVVRFQEGEAIAAMLNLNTILKSGDISQNFELKSGDWIYVHKRLTINWTHVLQFVTLTLTAINLYITIQNSE